MPKVSVIVPVYNTEKYLPKCLDSLINQTLKDIEIICINDGSTDGSLTLLNQYVDRDERFKVINFKENEGAAVARNRGIDTAEGEYIGFVDSDDFVDLDFYEKLYKKAKETGADIVKGDYKYKNIKNPWTINRDILEEKSNFLFGYCSAIFRNNLIASNHISFPNLKNMEDPVFAFNAAIKANKVVIVDDAYINITIRDDSQTAGIPTTKQVKDTFTGLRKILDVADNSNISEKSYAHCFAFLFNINFMYCIKNKNADIRQFCVTSIMNLYNRLKYKRTFLQELTIKNEFLAKSLEGQNSKNLVNYESMFRIYHIRKQLKNA